MKLLTLAVAVTVSLSVAAPAKSADPQQAERPIDLVICLDTSNSMDGLIDAAKQKLWDIVNELGRARPKPHLRVALCAYGTPSYGVETGYVKKLTDLTDDLDTVYGKLTELRTNGGDEYVARVVRDSVLEQPWSADGLALKIIIVAGNEPATQDPQFNSLDVAKQAITRGIIVDTIYCGPPNNGEADGWRAVARAADGQFASIDQNHGTIVVATPFDQKLAELSGAVNQTYVAYGGRAREGAANQAAIDQVVLAASPAVVASRAVAKVNGQYRNATWDLVDARAQQKDFDLSKVKDAELPADMQKLTLEQRQTYLDDKAKERAGLQKQINELNQKRQQYIAEELKKGGQNTDKAFDAAMLGAIREQAQRRQFTFGE